MMLNSMMGLAEKRLNEKKPAQATSRKGCMRGKGGPENATCMYKGVRQRTWGKWVAEIREANNGARLWLGTFDTSYEAAMAYDAAARKLHGPTAKLNLPELAATTRFPPSSGSFSIIRVTEGFYGNHLPVVNPGTLLCENNSYPTNEKPEVLKKFDYSENLNVNLPEFDDSAIWKEAAATMDYQAMADPGIFFDDYDDETFWGPIKFPWE